MRHNGHLLQSNKGVATIGEGSSVVIAGYSFPDGGFTNEDSYVRSASTSEHTVNRSIGDNDISYLDGETRYKSIYVDRIYCARKISSDYKYNEFFGTTPPSPAEVLTAGQIADYLMNPDKGVMLEWVGDHFNDTINNFYVGTEKPYGSTWKDLSLYDKMKNIFTDLFSNVPANRLNIYAGTVTATTFSGAVSSSGDITTKSMFAGKDVADSNYIFKVIGGATGTKRIEIVRQMNGLTNPSGIEGTLNSESSLGVGAIGNFSYIDVGRYYFRDSTEKRAIATIGTTYISADSAGVFFQFASRKLTLPYPTMNADVVITKPSGIQAITVPNSSSLTVTLSNDESRFKIERGGTYRLFRVDSNNKMKLDHDGSGTGIEFKAIASTYSSDHYFLTSSAGSSGIDTYGTNPGTSTSVPFFNFKYNVTNQRVRVGMKGGLAANESKFYVSQFDGSTDVECVVPRLASACQFIVTDPASDQAIEGNLAIDGTLIAGALSVDNNIGWSKHLNEGVFSIGRHQGSQSNPGAGSELSFFSTNENGITYSPGSKSFVIQYNAVYKIGFNSVATGVGECGIAVYKNGSSNNILSRLWIENSVHYISPLSSSNTIRLAVGDIITLRSTYTNGSVAFSNTYLSIEMVAQ